MLHKLGFEFLCPECDRPKTEEDMAPSPHDDMCKDCFLELSENYTKPAPNYLEFIH